MAELSRQTETQIKALSENRYHGPEIELLPAYLRQRLAPLFAAAQDLLSDQRLSADKWLIRIDLKMGQEGPRREWVDYQENFNDLRFKLEFPEAYGYTEGGVSYHVSVLEGSATDLNTCISPAPGWVTYKLFHFLCADSELFRRGYFEELGHMASYSIDRVTREI